MDVKISNGDIVLDRTGEPVYVDGIEEILQRVLICITAEKRGFIYDKNMGCDPLVDISTERGKKKLEARLREAIVSVSGAQLSLINAEKTQDSRIRVQITLNYNNEKRTAEVIV